MILQATTWQTVGPYFRIGLEHLDTAEIAAPDLPGQRVAVEGRVLDGEGKGVPDAVVEIWQANASGQYANKASHPAGFRGFGRIPTGPDGRFSFITIRPGPVPGPRGTMQSPHLLVRIMMRGLLKDLITRMYFPDESLGADAVMQLVPEPRRGTLIALPSADDRATFIWDINLQGEHETVFFDC